MSIPASIYLLPPDVLVSGNGSQQNIYLLSPKSMQFGMVQQTYPFCERIGEGQYCLFSLNEDSKIISIDSVQYFIIPDQSIFLIEAPATVIPPP